MAEFRENEPSVLSIRVLADIPRHQAMQRPHTVALSYEGKETTYQELNVASNLVASGLLAAGLKPSSRVAILDKNTDSFFEIWLGAAKVNAVLVPINARLAAPEVEFILNDAEVEVLFIGDSFLELFAKIREELASVRKVIVLNSRYAEWRNAQVECDPDLAPEPDDVCIQLYTSGTTGHPKGVQLTSKNLIAGLFSEKPRAVLGTWMAEDVLLLAMPLFHIAGCGAGMLGLLVGMKTIIVSEFVPLRIIEKIQHEQITIVFFVPAMILALVAEKQTEEADLSSLRRIIYGASPISPELLKSALRIFKHSGFVQIYGLTETTGMITALSPEDHHRLADDVMKSCGRSVAGVELRIVDADGKALAPRQVGEITCRTAQNMKGYWNLPAETARTLKESWLYTGDAGYLDEDGYLYIYDRIKDMIVSGGENIYSAEIESALSDHPDIAEIAAIGVPDERWGEAVKVLVVLKQHGIMDTESILNHARARLAGYKIPKSVEFLARLPKNPSGKILKRELRDRYWQGFERRVN